MPIVHGSLDPEQGPSEDVEIVRVQSRIGARDIWTDCQIEESHM
jgi:hypothetical protein